jgi:hypothetical protein
VTTRPTKGEGIIDFAPIFATADADWYVVEQDACAAQRWRASRSVCAICAHGATGGMVGRVASRNGQTPRRGDGDPPAALADSMIAD